MSNASKPPAPPLRSEFAGDPDMAEIIELFVREMPDRVSRLNKAWEDQSLEELRRLAHQLKGAGGGYGFGAVSAAAGKVERSLCSLGNGSVESTLEQLRREFADLVGLCERVSL